MARRSNKEASFYRRADGRFEGKVELLTASGDRKRFSRYGKTRTEVQRKIKELVAMAEGGSLTNAKPLTVAEYLAEWAKAPDLKPSSRRARDLNRRRVIPVIGSVPLPKLTPEHIRKVDNHLVAQGLSGASRNQAFDCLKAAMGEAVRDRLITISPFMLINWVPPVAYREMRFLTGHEQAKLYSVNDGWTPIWQFLLATGVRSGEAFGLSWRNVDLDGGRISIVQTIEEERGGWILHSPKTPQSRRTIQVPYQLVDLMRAVKEDQDAEAEAKAGLMIKEAGGTERPAWSNPSAFVFTREGGAPVLPSMAYRALHKALATAGVERCRVHDLRHTFVANHLNNGTPILAVSRMLGHADVGFTLRVYGHITTEVQEAAAELNGRLLEEAVRLGQVMSEVA